MARNQRKPQRRRRPKVKTYRFNLKELERMKSCRVGGGPGTKAVKLSDGSVTYPPMRGE